jgi:hypothetical protein
MFITPKLGLQPKTFGEACWAFWQVGVFVRIDERSADRDAVLVLTLAIGGNQGWARSNAL